MTKLLIFDAFTLLICENFFVNYALLWCKTFSLKIYGYAMLQTMLCANKMATELMM